MAEHTPHTPTPWLYCHQDKRGDLATVCYVADFCVTADTPSYEFHGTPEQDAAFIVRAVNSHDALVDILTELLGADGHDAFEEAFWERARAALSLAQPEGK